MTLRAFAFKSALQRPIDPTAMDDDVYLRRRELCIEVGLLLVTFVALYMLAP